MSDILANDMSNSDMYWAAKHMGWLPIDAHEASYLAFKYAWIYESIEFNSGFKSGIAKPR